MLDTAFSRVQSLIVTAAHPLSLITRGHMICRRFWASYLSHSLSHAECNQLRKEFVSKCQVGKADGNQLQLSPEEYEVHSILTNNQTNIAGPHDEEYYDQILDDLPNQSDTNEAKTMIQAVNNSTQEKSTNAVSVSDSSSYSH